MTRFNTGDLVRYKRGPDGGLLRSLRRAEDAKARFEKIGLVFPSEDVESWNILTGVSSTMVRVRWSDETELELVHDYQLEIVPTEER